jgi:dUTPase
MKQHNKRGPERLINSGYQGPVLVSNRHRGNTAFIKIDEQTAQMVLVPLALQGALEQSEEFAEISCGTSTLGHTSRLNLLF